MAAVSALAEMVAGATVAGGTRLVAGTTVRGRDGGVEVAVQGRRVAARWLDTAAARPGQTVLVALTSAGVGQSSAVVLGRLGAEPRPTMGVVRTVLASTAEVEAGGTRVTCAWVGATPPAVGDRVRLLWQGAEATILGVSGSTAADGEDGGALAPEQSVGSAPSGVSVLRATASGSWAARGRWSSAVVQGSGPGVEDSRGGWGYGAGVRALAGVRVVEAWVRLTGRAVSGTPDAALALRLACHAQTDLLERPSPVGAVWEASVPGRAAVWPLDVPIPVERAQWLVDHAGGLMVGGGSYGGVMGLDAGPESGRITMNWERE